MPFTFVFFTSTMQRLLFVVLAALSIADAAVVSFHLCNSRLLVTDLFNRSQVQSLTQWPLLLHLVWRPRKPQPSRPFCRLARHLPSRLLNLRRVRRSLQSALSLRVRHQVRLALSLRVRRQVRSALTHIPLLGGVLPLVLQQVLRIPLASRIYSLPVLPPQEALALHLRSHPLSS